MDIIKYISSEIGCFLKATLDISVQKIEQIFNLGKNGL